MGICHYLGILSLFGNLFPKMRANNDQKSVKFSPGGITQFFWNDNKNAYLVTHFSELNVKKIEAYFFRNPSRTQILTFMLRQEGESLFGYVSLLWGYTAFPKIKLSWILTAFAQILVSNSINLALLYWIG